MKNEAFIGFDVRSIVDLLDTRHDIIDLEAMIPALGRAARSRSRSVLVNKDG